MGKKGGGMIGTSACHGMGGNQVFAFTNANQIMSDDNCLDVSDKKGNSKISNIKDNQNSFPVFILIISCSD